MKASLKLSPLGHTWILDLDGSLLKHNGYILDGYDTFLDGAIEFLRSIPKNDMIIFLTSRLSENSLQTEEFLRKHDIQYNHIIYNAPYGERVVINDRKPSGLDTAIAVNLTRDAFYGFNIEVDDSL